jgi:tungstate transport system ATP-binding protein
MHATATKIVMVTHNMGQARRMGDEVIFLHRGRAYRTRAGGRFFAAPPHPRLHNFWKASYLW